MELDETLLKCENFRQFDFETSRRIDDKVTRIEIEACVFEPIWKTLQNRKDVHDNLINLVEACGVIQG